MIDEMKPDMSCHPYRRKGVYIVIIIPYVAILISVFMYLWSFNVVYSLILLSFYLGMCYFQEYCCAYQECPYIGEFCPALAGIYPANILAKIRYGGKKIVKSKKTFEINAAVATVCWIGIMGFPLYWIAKMGILLAVGYVVLHAVYYAFHGLMLCPVCAIRDTCPGGKLQGLVITR